MIEAATLAAIADRWGTPCYVYDAQGMRARHDELKAALRGVDHRIHYAVKANSTLGVLALFHELGTGFDIVSGGELARVLEVGGDAADVVFSGVGKRADEIDFALKAGVGCFNVESAAELARIEARAELLGRAAPISLRVNPQVDPQTHPYIATGLRESKFGVAMEDAPALYRRASASEHLRVVGIDCHIGSQIQTWAPFREAGQRILELRDTLAADGIDIEHVDLGGGLGVAYDDDAALDVAAYGQGLRELLGNQKVTLLLEPGRYLVANNGLLLTRVEYLKPGFKNFAIVDAAMNDLLRPALYQAYHHIERVGAPGADALDGSWNIVGPICESGDFLAHDRDLTVAAGDLLAVHSAGAYGMSQASNYNSRGRAPEVLVDAGEPRLIRARETLNDLLGPERAALAGG